MPSLVSKLRKIEGRRNHHGRYKYPHSLHNVTAKQSDEEKQREERTEVKESERESKVGERNCERQKV